MSRPRPLFVLSLWRGLVKVPRQGRYSPNGLITREILDHAVSAAAARYGVTEAEIMGRSLRPQFVTARHYAWWLLRQHRQPDGSPRFSYPEIALPWGVDHTSPMRACERFLDREGASA